MNLESTTNSASASGPEFEPQSYRIRVRDVSLIPNGQTSVRGFSLATLAGALAACGGGSSGGPAAPPPPPPNTAPTASPDAGAATEDGEAVTGSTGGADEDGGPSALTYSVSGDATYGSLTVADDGTWTYTVDNANDAVQALAEGGDPLTDTATITVSDGEDSVEATVTITITGVNDAPTGDDGAGAVTAGMDMAATGDVNPADVDVGDTHTFEVGTAASNGTLTVDEAGAWTYMVDHDNEAVVALAEGATMEDTATIVVTDNNGATAEVTVTITITGVNEAPTAEDGTGAVTAGMDMAATGDVKAMDVDVGDTHTFAVATAASNGTLTVDEAGAWSYALDHDNEAVVALAQGATMEDTATIVVTDNNGATAEVTVTITITGVNEAPTAEDGTGAVTAGMDMAATGDVKAMDVDVGDTHTFAVATAASNGTLTVDEAGAWSYALDHDNEAVVALAQGATMEDTATIVVTDNNGATAEVTVTITITGVNEAPTAEDGTGAVTAGMDMAATGDVKAMDVDVGDTHTFAVATAASNGTLTVDEAGAWSYALDHDNEAVVALAQGATMEDTATIVVTDNNGATAEVTVTITITGVNEAPTAEDGTGAVTAGMDMAATGDVKAMDVDVGDTHTFAVATAASNGTLTVDEAGAWSYALDHDNEAVVALAQGATMEDTATIVVTDNNGATAEVTVTITITGVNEAPTAEDGTGAVTAGMDMAATGDVKAMDVDVGDTHTFAVATAASNGTLTVDEAGAWSYALDHDNEAVVALAQGATMEDTATIVVTDNNGATAEVTVTITITGVNEAPTAEDGTGAVTAGMDMAATGDVKAMDVDVGDTHTFAVATAASNGTLTVDEAGAWSYALDHDNEAVVALAEGATMEDTATIVVTDNNGGSAEVTVTITITGVNEAPTAEDGAGAVTAGMDMAATGDVKAMDVDVGDTHTFAVATAATYGTLTVDEAGAWSYAVDDANATVVALAQGATMEDTATVMIDDGNGGTAEVTVTVTITGANDAPSVGVADGETPDGMPAVSTVAENTMGALLGAVTLSDPDGQVLGMGDVTTSDTRFVIKPDSEGGLWLALADDASLDHEEAATVDVTLTVTDEHGATGETTATITVSNVDEPPNAPTVVPRSDLTVAENDESGPNVAQLLTSDPEGDTYAFSVDNHKFEIENVGNAALLKLKDGMSLDHEASADGTITLMVTATDAAGNTSDATPVVIIVSDVNEDPTADDGTGAVTAGDGMAATGNVNAMDVDDGDTHTFSVETQAAFGMLSVDEAGEWSYTVDDANADVVALAQGATMEDTATVMVSDGGELSTTAMVTITITGANDAPTVGVADGMFGGMPAVSTVAENTMGALLGAVTLGDPDGQVLNAANVTTSDPDSFVIKTDSEGGLWLALADDASLDHEKAATVDVTLTVTDEHGATGETTVTITVTNVDEAPYAPMVTPTESNLMVAENDDSGANIALVTAHDPEDGAVSFVVDNTDFEIEAVGTAALLKLKDGVSLDHEATEDGTITLMVTASDLAGNTSAATPVVITVTDVNEVPTAEDGTGAVTALADMPGTGDVNAMDVDDDTLTYTVETQATNGTLSVDEAGEWSYTVDDANPAVVALAKDATMEDTATVMVSDGLLSTTATVTITITGANEDPTAEDGTGAVTALAMMPGTGDVIAMDDDVGDTHTYSVGTQAAFGTLTVDEVTGAWSYAVDDANADVVALAKDATMEDTATVMVTDNNGGTTEATVTITITGANEDPTAEDGTGAVTALAMMPATGDVIAMDDDVGDTHTYSVGTQAAFGTLTVDEVTGAWSYAVDDANADVVALAKDATMEDTATVMVTDNNGGTTEATVTITITGANEDPTAEDGTGAVTALAMMPATGDVIAMDDDVGDTHTYSVGTPAAFGTLTVDLVTGTWSYEVDDANAAVVALAHGETMEDTATVMVTDNNGGTAEATVTITINGKNEAPDAPTVTPSTGLMVTENDTNGVNLASLSSTDPDGDDVTFAVVDNPDFEIQVVGGVVLLKVADGVPLDHEATEDGTITLMVTATDGVDTSDPTAVMVTVTDVNEAPGINIMDGETPERDPAVSVIDENDTGFVGAVMVSDPEDTLGEADIIVSDPRFGIMTDASGGLWLVLNEGIDAEDPDLVDGTVTVTLTVTDSGGHTDEAEVTVTITNINEPPTITLQDGFVPPNDHPASNQIDENERGPVAEIIVSDPEDMLTDASITVTGADGMADDRFTIVPDVEGGLWLFLDEAQNHEVVDSIDVTVTVTDSGGLTESMDYTIIVRNANDAPHATGEGVSVIVPAMGEDPATTEDLTLLEATSGEPVDTMTLDLDGTFDDEDDSDVLFTYTLSKDTPPWVELINVVYVTNEDGSISATGELVTTPPGHDPVGAFTVTIIATDDEDAAGTASFDIIVDDGNDVPTAIDLTNLDESNNAFFDLEVNEGAQGIELGYLTVEDQDDPRHSHGQHTWMTDNDNFLVKEMNGRQVLMVADDAEIDFEEGAAITLTVTVTDGGMEDETQIIQVQVNDMNDPVEVANQPGSWWVTIDDDLDPETVAQGAYLDFSLETEGDTRPLFTDGDESGDNAKLTYAFVSGAPDWLEIDGDTGRMYSKAGEEDDELPTRGVYEITVSATDGADSSQEATFKLAVVVSDVDNDDNDQTQIESASGMDIDENPDPEAGTVVATFTITDEDLSDVAGLHPWGDVTVTLDSVQNTTDSSAPVPGDAAWFELEMVSESGDTQNWQVKLTAAGATAMNYEAPLEDLRLTISAGDAVTDAADRDTRTINFDVDDVNEAPDYTQDASTSTDLGATPTTAVDQQEDGVITLYLNLYNMYKDPDEDHDDDDITFTVSTDTAWISVATQPVEWETYMEGPDGDADDTDDNGAWGPANPTNDDDMVAVVTIDRTMMHSQDADGSFTITATDSDGAETTTKVPVTITDQDVAPAADAEGVELTDDTPYQNDRLSMWFDESVDPDFTGTEANADNPILVVYEWKRDNDENPVNGDETLLSVSAGERSTYTVTQEDVGMVIQGTVTYFELFDGMIVQTKNMAALDARSELVQDRPDDATGTITFGSTNADDELVATVMVGDEDGIVDTTLTYVWESSVNGRGGWTPFADDDTGDGTAMEQTTAIGAAQQGMHVRLVVEFNDENGTPERVVSETIKVGTINTIDLPTITGFGTEANEGIDAVAVGRTLEVDVTGADVQWMAGGMVVGTGTSFTVTSAQAGMMITAVITSKDGDNVTSLVATAAVTIAGGGTGANTSPIVVDEDVVLLGTAPAMVGDLEEYRTTIDANELFEDVEGGLTFSFAAEQALGTDQYPDETLDVYLTNDGTQLLIIDETTGDVRYVTTKATGHGDGGDTDGGGNTVDIIVTATDGANTVTNTVSLAIDVPGTYEGSGITDTVVENIATTADANVGTMPINITDLNSPSNEYGQYEWATDNDAYTVTANETDSSMATVARVAGKMLDGNDTNLPTDGEVTVTITATPMSGGDAIEITLTVTVTNDPDDDADAPAKPNEVPGLKDNETGSDDDTDDETEDNDTDDDDDAGNPPEADAMAAFASMLDDGLF